MKTYTHRFNAIVKRLEVGLDYSDCEIEDCLVISVMGSMNMDFCVRMIGITKEGKIIVQQFDHDIDSRWEADFSEIISSWDKFQVLEALEKFTQPLYYTMDNVGKAKYTVSMHDGFSTHKDGSKFYGIALFSNKIKYNIVKSPSVKFM